MKTAGVVIDDWKLPIFKRRLDEAGFSYEEKPGVTQGTLTLMVEYEWLKDLHPIIQIANNEAKEEGLSRPA